MVPPFVGGVPVTSFLPVIGLKNQLVYKNASIPASWLLASASDTSGDPVTSYCFYDESSGGGYFTLDGVRQADNSSFTVSAADLSLVRYVGGPSPGSDTVDVCGLVGLNWSQWQIATVTTTQDPAPIMTVQDQTVGTGAALQASLLIKSTNDPLGYGINSYKFRDDGGGGGYFALNGTRQADGTWITVSAANLAQLAYVGGSANGTDLVDVSAGDGSLWSSAVTAMVTTQGTLPATNPWLAFLADANIKSDAAKYIVNNSLDYAGMLAILDNVAARGAVTSQEFTDLKNIVSWFNKSNGIQVSPYLAYISNALVNGDPANGNWTGGGLSHATLGNLAVGSSQTQMDELIGKWFLGTDLPEPIFNGSVTGVYFDDTNPLFNSTGNPSINDINQGAPGNCTFLSSLADMAQDDQSTIESMFVDNGNGSYGVRFCVDNRTVYVTINTYLPAYSGSTNLIGNRATDIWGSLVEKAFVQLNEEPGVSSSTASNEYDLFGTAGWPESISYIVGKSITYYQYGSYSLSSWNSLESKIVTALQNSEEVYFASSGNTTISGKVAFVDNHAFSVIGYDNATGDFIMRNPWGVASGQNWLTEFEASMADFYSVNGYLAVAGGAPVWPTRVVADFNGNGTSDILWRNATTGQVIEWQMNGGVSLTTSNLLITDTNWTVVGTGDFNDDGTADILWRNAATGAVMEWLMSNGTVSSNVGLLTDPVWKIAGTGDFTGNGTDDILWRNASTGAVQEWLMNNGSLSSNVGLLNDTAWTVAGTGDFTGNGTDDILWRNASTGAVVEWEMNNGSLSSTVGLLTDTAWTVAGTGDFNGDGTTDILWRNASTGAVTEWLMNNGTLSSNVGLLTDPTVTVTGTGDFNGDGTTDILLRNPTTGAVSEWLMNNGTLASSGTLLTDTSWNVAPIGTAPAHVVADFKGDGTSDILLRDPTGGVVGEFLMSNGQPTWAPIGWMPATWQVAGVGDFTGDGTSDILFRDPTGGGIGDFTMNNNQPTWAAVGWVPTNRQVAGIGDFNGDGTSDILLRDTTGGGIGEFQMHNNQPTWVSIGWAPLTWQVAGVGDFNGDGTSDILLRDTSGGGLVEFQMNNNQPTWASISWVSPSWNVVGIGDFNGDGTSDILFEDPTSGNLGDFLMKNGQATWASIGRADASLQVAGVGDYNGDGTSDILFRDPASGALTAFFMHSNVPTWAAIGSTGTTWHVLG
jgi:hypothetical protein